MISMRRGVILNRVNNDCKEYLPCPVKLSGAEDKSHRLERALVVMITEKKIGCLTWGYHVQTNLSCGMLNLAIHRLFHRNLLMGAQ